MFQEHARHAIWNNSQHPYKHTLADFAYNNPALPGVTTLEASLNWILAVLYPNTQPAVATVGDLPLVGNTLNDYRVVLDDGDGKGASYRWEQREGEVSPSWHKIYDMDWGSDAVLSAFQLRTQDLYVFRRGYDDLDASGVVVVGLYAGQVVTGGLSANTNLTLRANAGDGVGPRTGYVQFDDQVRPTLDATFSLGNASFRFKDAYFSDAVNVGATITIAPGSITDTSGAISFGNENLSTTGNIDGAILTAATSFVVGTLTVSDGSISDTDGSISFGATALSTTGTITGATGSQFGTLTLANGSITDSSGNISFGNENLLTTGTLGAGDATVTRLDSDNLRLDGNTLSVTNLNGNLLVQANGSGIIDFQSAVTSLGITATGTVGITGQLNIDNLRFDGNVLSSTNLNGDITLTPNGTGVIVLSNNVEPGVDGNVNLGSDTKRFKDFHISGAFHDGTNIITATTLMSFRDANVGVAPGMTLFWDGSKWAASLPDTEISHASISGLITGDAGHTQFVMLAGRSGGQTIQGGAAASENLVLESTADVTKGAIFTKDHLRPFTDASYSGGWSGTDLGGVSNYFRDIYTKGELKGGRLENFTVGTLPASSAQNVGRLAWTTDAKKVYVDNGTSWQVAGVGKYINDESFDGVQTTKTVTVSASITDARNAVWALHNNAGDFERIYTTIKAISATQVQIVTTGALPAGSYRLIGLE